MKYGYARVSSVGQDLTIQVQKLNEAGCDVIREEKVSGTSLWNSPLKVAHPLGYVYPY